MNPADMTVEERLRLIEAHVVIQEAELVAIRAERIEADRLAQSVGRLGENANALGEALLTVDRNQQQLAKLAGQLDQVRQEAVSKEDLESAKQETVQSAQEFRKVALSRIYTTVILMIVAALFIVGFYVDRVAKERVKTVNMCRERAYSARTVNEFANSQIEIETTNPFIDDRLRARRIASLSKLKAAFPVPACEGS